MGRAGRDPDSRRDPRHVCRDGPIGRCPATVFGTVAVTAVGMFAGGGGFGITSLSLMSLEIIVGGVSQRPSVIEGQVTVRDVLDLTIAIDHNVVDGAPAARFAAEFRELLESTAVLSPHSGAVQAPATAIGLHRGRTQRP